jgi:hypothetical protein
MATVADAVRAVDDQRVEAGLRDGVDDPAGQAKVERALARLAREPGRIVVRQVQQVRADVEAWLPRQMTPSRRSVSISASP